MIEFNFRCHKEWNVTLKLMIFPRVCFSFPSEKELDSDWLVLYPVSSLLAPPFPLEPVSSPLRTTAASPPSVQWFLLSDCFWWYHSLNLNMYSDPAAQSPSASHEEKQSSSVCSCCGLSAPQTWWWQRGRIRTVSIWLESRREWQTRIQLWDINNWR